MTAQEKPKARAAADALWVVSFLATWGLLITMWNTFWAFLLVPLFLCHLAGLSEFVHQTVHRNLFARSLGWNRALGRVAAALISVDFDTYRAFHLKHHRFANTPDDPERPLYQAARYLEMTAGWESLSTRDKLARIPRIIGYTAEALASFGSGVRFVRIMRWIVPIAIVAIGVLQGTPWYLLPVQLIVAWYVPLFLLIFVDLAFAHSEHYGTGDAEEIGAHGTVPYDVQYALAWNLKVPAPLEFFLLKRNIHAEHHLSPGIHWTNARDQGNGRSLPFVPYLKTLWKLGPRTCPAPTPRTSAAAE